MNKNFYWLAKEEPEVYSDRLNFVFLTSSKDEIGIRTFFASKHHLQQISMLRRLQVIISEKTGKI